MNLQNRHKFLVGISALIVIGSSVFYFLNHGYPVAMYVDKSDIPKSNYTNCQQGPPARLQEVAPIQSQIDTINDKINAIGQKLSSDVPTGMPPISILDLANKYDKSQVPVINSLDAQHGTLEDQLTVINRKYGC